MKPIVAGRHVTAVPGDLSGGQVRYRLVGIGRDDREKAAGGETPGPLFLLSGGDSSLGTPRSMCLIPLWQRL